MIKDIKIKAGSPLQYTNTILPSMIKYIKRGDGFNGFSGINNHHTVVFTLSNSNKITAHAYETKTMIVMEWGVDNDTTI